ncbi:MAG TPA: hypothetical protein VMR52_09385 [Dehalococcoidia bacterium]|nr:hypothetical protein [Dehalococcoidia bacterium]
MADLEPALADRHPDNFHKHTLMIACSAVIVEDGRRLLVRDQHGFWAGAPAAGSSAASAPKRPSCGSSAKNSASKAK